MPIRTVYSTNDAMNRPTGPDYRNAHGCAVAIGAGSDTFSIAVVGDGHGYALVDRAELKRIRDAIDAELSRAS